MAFGGLFLKTADSSLAGPDFARPAEENPDVRAFTITITLSNLRAQSGENTPEISVLEQKIPTINEKKKKKTKKMKKMKKTLHRTQRTTLATKPTFAFLFEPSYHEASRDQTKEFNVKWGPEN